jgi:hypothetical protein
MAVWVYSIFGRARVDHRQRTGCMPMAAWTESHEEVAKLRVARSTDLCVDVRIAAPTVRWSAAVEGPQPLLPPERWQMGGEGDSNL